MCCSKATFLILFPQDNSLNWENTPTHPTKVRHLTKNTEISNRVEQKKD